MKTLVKQKKIIILFIIFILTILFTSQALAADYYQSPDFINRSSHVQGAGNQQLLNDTINKMVTILSSIGSILSVIVLIILGIKYMMGSIEEKAQYKKSLTPYISGCVIVFAASTLTGLVYNIIINIF